MYEWLSKGGHRAGRGPALFWFRESVKFNCHQLGPVADRALSIQETPEDWAGPDGYAATSALDHGVSCAAEEQEAPRRSSTW